MKRPASQQVKDFENYCVVLSRFEHTFQFNYDSYDEAYAELKKLIAEESSYCLLMGFKSIVGMYAKELQEEVLDEMGIEVDLEELEWESNCYIADMPNHRISCHYQIKLEGLS